MPICSHFAKRGLSDRFRRIAAPAMLQCHQAAPRPVRRSPNPCRTPPDCNERRTSRLRLQHLTLAECPLLVFRRGIPVETKSHQRYPDILQPLAA